MTGTPTPEEKIRILTKSVRCFQYGLLSLIPLAGAFLAGISLAAAGQSKPPVRSHWNPAAHYRRWGIGLASVGLLFNIFLGVIVCSRFIDFWTNN